MKLFWISHVRALVLMLVAATATAVSAQQTPRTLRLGIGLAPESPLGKAVVDFASRVERYTQGSLQIELQASGKAGNDITMIKALQEGTLEMTAPDSSTLAALEKRFSAINYPFTFLSETEADTILDGEWGQRLLDRLPQQGLIGLTYWENGFRQMTNSRKPLSTATDFEGVRLRTMQNPMLVDSFNRLGFAAVPMPFTQVYEALKTQAVDGQENPLPTILTSRFYEVQKYLTLSRHVYSAFVLLVSQKVWNTLTPAQHEALRKAAVESRAFERRVSRDGAERALADLKAKGMVVTSIPRADSERIRNRLREVFDKYNADIGVSTMIALYVELDRIRTAQAAAVATAPPAEPTPVAKAAVVKKQRQASAPGVTSIDFQR